MMRCSLASLNGAPWVVDVTEWNHHGHRPGLELLTDTTNEGLGLLPGHHRGPPLAISGDFSMAPDTDRSQGLTVLGEHFA